MKEALKNKDSVKRDLLRVVKSEISKLENTTSGVKDFSDSDTMKLLSSMINNLKLINTEESNKEIEILSAYLPKQLDETEVSTIINKIISENSFSTKKDTGNVIKLFNEKYSGSFDSKRLGSLIGQILK